MGVLSCCNNGCVQALHLRPHGVLWLRSANAVVHPLVGPGIMDSCGPTILRCYNPLAEQGSGKHGTCKLACKDAGPCKCAGAACMQSRQSRQSGRMPA